MTHTEGTNLAVSEPLSVAEGEELRQAEAVIEKGQKTFVEVGDALLRIQEQRLYRRTHRTFGSYCRERWGWSRSRAYQLIEAASVIEDLSTNGGQTQPSLPPILPTSERQARPLAELPQEERRAVWEQLVEETDGQPTAKAVERAAKKAKANGGASKSVPTQPKPKVHPVDAPMPPAQKDEEGDEVPEALIPVFEKRAEFIHIARSLIHLAAEVRDLSKDPAGTHIPKPAHMGMTLEGYAEDLLAARPGTVSGKTWLPMGRDDDEID